MRKPLGISILLHLILFSAALLYPAAPWKSHNVSEDEIIYVSLASLGRDPEIRHNKLKGHPLGVQKAKTASKQKTDESEPAKKPIILKTKPKNTKDEIDSVENRAEEYVIKDRNISRTHPENNFFTEHTSNVNHNGTRDTDINNKVASYKNFGAHDFSQDRIDEHEISQHKESGNGIALTDVYRRIGDAIEKTKRYPMLARKKGIEGTVFVTFRISPNGEPREIEIRRSSGYNILDRATLKVVEQAAPYPFVDNLIEVPVAYQLRK